MTGYRVLTVKGDWIVQLCDWLQGADCRVTGLYSCVTGYRVLTVEGDWIIVDCTVV